MLIWLWLQSVKNSAIQVICVIDLTKRTINIKTNNTGGKFKNFLDIRDALLKQNIKYSVKKFDEPEIAKNNYENAIKGTDQEFIKYVIDEFKKMNYVIKRQTIIKDKNGENRG